VRHIFVGVFAISVAAAIAVPRATSGDTDRFRTSGISVEHPSAWFVTTRPLSDGVNPVYRFTVSTVRVHRTPRDSGPCLPGIARQLPSSAVLVYLREALGADRRIALPRMPPRPRPFRLPKRPNLCGFTTGASQWLGFKEAGRVFYLGVHVGPKASPTSRRAVIRLLNGMRIMPRR
jgi:hypothetical protein